MNNIEEIISESIRTGKWLNISYQNGKNETTFYWIAIYDIDLEQKLLKVAMFNDKISMDCIHSTIRFDRIKTAKVLDFTSYNTPINLINKIENNREAAKWLKYESFNNNILKYYINCNELDNDPYQKDSILIEGIDKDTLIKKYKIVLNETQSKQVINYIKRYNSKQLSNEINYLILSTLSIEKNDKKFVILYYDVLFNPENKTLSIKNILRVNQTFLFNNKRHSLNTYMNVDPEEFINNICNHTDEYLNDYTEIIRSNLKYGEIINQLPEFMVLKREIKVNLEPTYNAIEQKYKDNELDYPLKAFFGNCNRFGTKRKEPAIVIYDQKVNIDQMRVIYNSMKYPITYVEGPPGTGKTQTILNVILSCFFNSKTTLVCSSNNKPINGIIEKLLFSYKEENDIPFPYLRLGNRDEIAKSTLRILDLYNYQTIVEPDDNIINSIKIKTNENNKDLVYSLELYEKRKELENKITSAQKLLNSINNQENKLYQNTKIVISTLLEDYQKIPIINNSDVLKLVNSVSDNSLFKQYMLYESIKYIKKLKTPRYSTLIDICKIENSDIRINEFNKWCTIDENIKLLENVFPIIITTNISSARLGTAFHTFDLVIMDEAGQCNSATALLPIARAKQLLLVGDSNQLKPVIVLEETINEVLKKNYQISDDYDYCKYSILDIMKNHDNISKKIMLTYHYRCGKKIIDFSNKRFYDNRLNLEYLTNEGNLSLINVKNKNSKRKNDNYEEAIEVVKYIKRNNLKDAAIITPFVNQQDLINSLLKENNITDITCSTIHQMQGGEKSTIIISPSISPKTNKKTFDWIKNNSEITNVAVTRAKENLIIVSDVEALKILSESKDNDLYSLAKYVYYNGETEISPNDSHTIQIGNSNGSINEDKFFVTISHFCSVNKIFQAKRNVKLSTLFSNDSLLAKSKLEFDIVLYTIDDTRLIPKIAIELQGGEHYGDFDRENSDTRKAQICKEKGIILLEIPNSFIKSYETIKELILSSCGQKIEQLELF